MTVHESLLSAIDATVMLRGWLPVEINREKNLSDLEEVSSVTPYVG